MVCSYSCSCMKQFEKLPKSTDLCWENWHLEVAWLPDTLLAFDLNCVCRFGPLWSSSRDVCLCVYIYIYVPFHCNSFLRPLIGSQITWLVPGLSLVNPPSLPLIGIGNSISIGRDIRCLLYAGFLPVPIGRAMVMAHPISQVTDQLFQNYRQEQTCLPWFASTVEY